MKRFINHLLLASTLLVATTQTVQAKRGFAIVVDPKSYTEAKAEISDYTQAIEQVQGMKVFIVQDRWGVPDSIRKELIRLHNLKTTPIEGAVLLGDIPVAMIRDAQHLTSAFKMNQKADRRKSSIPSDRYYDDFGMRFKSLGKDEKEPYYYYSLMAESPQFVRSDIFVGRIRPTDVNGTSRYDKLRKYLRKCTAEKRKTNPLDKMLFFAGHGYVSESVVVRQDEKAGLYEHFPWLHKQSSGISYMDHQQQNVTKYRLMNELMRPDLDYAILHHHGAPDTEYMDGLPKVNSAEQAKEVMTDYCRNYLRDRSDKVSDRDSVMQVLMKRFDIPASWISNAFDPKVMLADSIVNADQDITLGDFAKHGYQPNCKVVMIDACFNGSFHLDDCIADEYIFNEGNTITCIANSVNVLQDKWSDRFMGLIGLGAYVGNIARFSGYLESQCIGDPTYAFTPAVKTADINELLSANNNYKAWQPYLNDQALPDMQCMAIQQLHWAHQISSAQLLNIFRNSNSALVRVEALIALSDIRDDNYIEALKLGAFDSYELVERFSVNQIGQSGDERLLPTLATKVVANNTSERVNFSLGNAMTMYPEDKLMAAVTKAFDDPSLHYIDKPAERKKLLRTIPILTSKYLEYVDASLNESLTVLKRLSAIRSTRNYCPPFILQKLMDGVKQTKDPSIQAQILESLGWRKTSYMAPQIEAFAKQISQDSKYAQSVRDEALKTYNRVHSPY